MRRTALDLERHLNPEQVAAVTHGEGPQLVLAGAGSGKTRVITYRIGWLVSERGVDPGHIAAMTFTNKAAGEMRERVEDLLGMHPLTTSVGTFHRYGLILLRRYGERIGLRRDFAILDTSDQLGLVKEALGAEGLSETAFSPRAVLHQISWAKNKLIEAAAYEAAAQNFFEKKVSVLYRRYQGLLGQASGVDFDDLIGLSVKLLSTDPEIKDRVRSRTRYLLVDEYQDTNHAQLRLVQELIGPAGNLTAVGDEDQGIYRWRGADLDNILDFERSFPGAVVRKLEQNYRSTQTILDVSGALIAHNVNRRGKRLWTENGGGARVEVYKASDEGDEASYIVGKVHSLRSRFKLGDLGILVRTNAQTRSIEEELLRREIPYSLVGAVRFYDRAEIKDLIAYLRVLRNPRDNFSLMRIINQPPRGIGKSTLELLRDRALQLGQPVWDVLYLDDLGTLPQRSASALRKFRDLIVNLQQAAEELPLPALLDRLLDQTAYTDLYRKDDPEDQARLENIREFLSAAQELTESSSYNSSDQDLLTSFLDHIALVTDLDNLQEEKGVSLMTLHSAKGLEFRAVLLGGLEDGLLPHFNSQGAREDIEEERRLLYVGMTRAKELLYLACCRRRRIAGRYQDQAESPFLEELPDQLLEVKHSPDLYVTERYDQRTQDIYSFFGQSRPAAASPSPQRPAAPSPPPQMPSYSRPRQQPAPSGRQVVPEPQEVMTPRRPLKRGSRVRHPTLGAGVVLELEGQGEEMRLTVFFEKAGKRKLVAKFANLEML
ncbi:MAG TPA: UvrD-helicase domain-containing protein [Thermoanaerobaculia bacterium]